MSHIKSIIRKGLRSLGYDLVPHTSYSREKLGQLNPWQEGFCDWNAKRLGISSEESRLRFRQSWDAIPKGHAGAEFRRFCDTSHQVYSVFFDDRPREIYDAYQFHGLMHFLRMLSYPEPMWPADHPILLALSHQPRVTIIDFGCGLAQSSISLAKALQGHGTETSLCLADIPTLRMEFLTWFCQRQGISCQFASCTWENPIPKLPRCDVFIAREVFEHLHNPMPYLEMMNNSLNDGGFLLTNIHDHQAEFMHVTPNLESIRNRLGELNYAEIKQHQLYRKDISALTGYSV